MTSIEYEDLYVRLQMHYNVKPDRRGFCHITCPHCGKEYKKTQRGPAEIHCSFGRKGWLCFSCHQKGNLIQLARQVGILTGDGPLPIRIETIRQHKETPPDAPPWWQGGDLPQRLLEQYADHPANVSQWQKYKPLRYPTIEKYWFGFGQMPASEPGKYQLSDRLIVPLIYGPKVFGFRGRTVDGSEPKWMSARGSRSHIWNLDKVRKGVRELWICENYVDAALIMQETTEWDAIATGGVGRTTIHPWELAKLKQYAPKRIVIAFDNDLPGQAHGERRQQFEREWRAEHPKATTPAACGPEWANQLRAAGFNTLMYEWPDDAKYKADIGDVIAGKYQMAFA